MDGLESDAANVPQVAGLGNAGDDDKKDEWRDRHPDQAYEDVPQGFERHPHSRARATQ